MVVRSTELDIRPRQSDPVIRTVSTEPGCGREGALSWLSGLVVVVVVVVVKRGVRTKEGREQPASVSAQQAEARPSS